MKALLITLLLLSTVMIAFTQESIPGEGGANGCLVYQCEARQDDMVAYGYSSCLQIQQFICGSPPVTCYAC